MLIQSAVVGSNKINIVFAVPFPRTCITISTAEQAKKTASKGMRNYV